MTFVAASAEALDSRGGVVRAAEEQALGPETRPELEGGEGEGEEEEYEEVSSWVDGVCGNAAGSFISHKHVLGMLLRLPWNITSATLNFAPAYSLCWQYEYEDYEGEGEGEEEEEEEEEGGELPHVP